MKQTVGFTLTNQLYIWNHVNITQKVWAQRKDKTYFLQRVQDINPERPPLHCGQFYDEGPTRGLTSCEGYFKHHYRNDQLQQNYQNMFLIENESGALTLDAFLQEERAACPTTLGANGRTPSWQQKASAGCWCKQHTIWSWEQSNSSNTPVTHTSINARSSKCRALFVPKIFLGISPPPNHAHRASLWNNRPFKGEEGIHYFKTKSLLERLKTKFCDCNLHNLMPK